MKNLLAFAIVALLAVPALALSGDKNGNGVIDHGNSGEVGSQNDGVHCAPGLAGWAYDTKVRNMYHTDAGFSLGYMCWGASCSPDGGIYMKVSVPGLNRPCCPGTTEKFYFNGNSAQVCCKPGSTAKLCQGNFRP